MKERILKQLIIDEGLRLFPYNDSKDLLTIGIGHCLETSGLTWWEMVSFIETNHDRKARFPGNYQDIPGEKLLLDLINDFRKQGITKDEALWLCKNDIDRAEADLIENFPWVKDAPEELQEILINMTFNMGIGSRKKKKGMLSFAGKGGTMFLLSIGEYEKAANNLEVSKWKRDTKSRAIRLIARVRALAKQ